MSRCVYERPLKVYIILLYVYVILYIRCVYFFFFKYGPSPPPFSLSSTPRICIRSSVILLCAARALLFYFLRNNMYIIIYMYSGYTCNVVASTVWCEYYVQYIYIVYRRRRHPLVGATNASRIHPPPHGLALFFFFFQPVSMTRYNII